MVAARGLSSGIELVRDRDTVDAVPRRGFASAHCLVGTGERHA
jgi:hypothetical protein